MNFNREKEISPLTTISLTRGLLYAAILQAITFLFEFRVNVSGETIALSPQLQHFVVKKWAALDELQLLSKELRIKFQDVDWIANSSHGFINESISSESLINSNDFLNRLKNIVLEESPAAL